MSSTLNDKLSQHWNCIQDNLFPWIEESLGPLSDKHRQLIDPVPLFGTLTNIEKEVFHESEKSLYEGVQI